MVKRLIFLWVTIILCGCTRPISQYLCDYYYNDAGGTRSHNKYKKFQKLDTPLPPGIEENLVFENLYSERIDNGEIKQIERRYLTRLFPNGKCAFKGFSLSEDLSQASFDIDTWEIGYYKKSKDGYRIYSYGTINCGQFDEYKLITWSNDTLKFKSRTYYRYVLKVSGIPDAWLIDQQPDW